MATKLASAFIDVSVRYASAQKQIAADFNGLQDQAERASKRAGDALEKGLGDGGRRAGRALQREMAGSRVGEQIGLFVGRSIGEGINTALPSSAKGAIRNLAEAYRRDGAAAAAGQAIGRTMGNAIKVGIVGAAGAGLAAVGYTLTQGFQRLEKIDQARSKLLALKNSVADVDEIMRNATDAVKGTAFSLDQAASAAAASVAAGIKPGKQLTGYLTTIADTAAIAGTSFEDMASIFNKVTTNNKAYTDDLQQLADRGVPIFQYLQEQYGVSGDALSKMVQDGKVSAADFDKALQDHIGGAAQKMGQSFSGAVDNMQASVARLGANFLTAIFGGNSVSALSGPTEAVNAFTAKLDQAGEWVKAHGGEIKQFFDEAKEAGKQFVDAIGPPLKTAADLLREYPEIIPIAVAGFGAFKTIEGVASLITSLKTISTLLKVELPASAAVGAAGIAANLAKVAVPAWLAYLVGQQNPAITPGLTLPDGTKAPDIRDPNFRFDGAPFGPGSLGGPAGAQHERRTGHPYDPFPGGTQVTPGNILNPPNFGSGQASGGDAAAAAPAGLTGNKGVVYQAMLQAGFPASEWGALQNLLMGESGFQNNVKNPSSTAYGMFQFLDSTWSTVGGSKTADPALQSQYGLQYIKQRYGTPSAAWAFWQSQSPHWYASGGAALGPGGPKSDSIPAMLSNGEHVWTADEVNAVGGQAKMYQLRAMARAGMIPGFDNGGAVYDLPLAAWDRLYDPRSDSKNNPFPSPSDQGGQAGKPWPSKIPPPGYKKGYEYAEPGVGNSIWTLQGGGLGAIGVGGKRRGFTKRPPAKKPNINDPFWSNRQGVTGYAEGGPVTLEDLLKQGVDPNTTQHGTGVGATPGPTPEQLQQLGQVLGGPQQPEGAQGGDSGRTQGYIPAAAGNSSVAGTSFLSGIYGMGAEVINGIIDQAANAASQAAGAAATVFAPGSGGAASGLTSAAISVGTQAAKRGVEYGAQMLGIGTDALIEQLTPFGAPRLLTTDVTGFMPQQAIMSAATTSIEKAFQQGNQPPGEGPQQHQGTGVLPGPPPPGPAQPGPFAAPPPPLETPPPPVTPPPSQPLPDQLAPPVDPLNKLFGGVYDSGGWLPPKGVAVNMSNRPEPILNHQQWGNLATIANSPVGEIDPKSGATYDYRTVIENVTVKDVAELERQMEDRRRLNTMRHRGRPGI